jgi:hypothetical protein
VVPAKIDARTLIRSGAEALVRMRHPTWGVVPPAYFIPEAHDPHFARHSREFVIERACRTGTISWSSRARSISRSTCRLVSWKEPQAVRDLCRRMPTHPAFGGLTIEIDSEEAIRDLDSLSRCARSAPATYIEPCRSIESRATGLVASMRSCGICSPSSNGMARTGTSVNRQNEHMTAFKRTVCRHHRRSCAWAYGASCVAIAGRRR